MKIRILLGDICIMDNFAVAFMYLCQCTLMFGMLYRES